MRQKRLRTSGLGWPWFFFSKSGRRGI